LYEEAWGQSFHFCRFAASEPFARHEHYLATKMNLKSKMKVLDVGCGVGGPAREIANFADIHVTGLNINDYQIQRATLAAERAGMADQLNFIKGDFMVSNLLSALRTFRQVFNRLIQIFSNYRFQTIASTPSMLLKQPAMHPASKARIPKSSAS
jgi:SAM-dependent methyltransferase